MTNLDDLEAKLNEWEKDAEDAVPSAGFTRTSDWDYAVKEHLKNKHEDEISNLISALKEDQASIGSDHDELTPNNEKEEADAKVSKIEVLLDRLYEFQKA